MRKNITSKFLLSIGLLCGPSMLYSRDISHPSLLYTPQRIEMAKQRMQQDTAMTSAWNAIRLTADELLKKNDINKLDYLALAYQMTGEKAYAFKIRDILLNAVKASSWGDSEMMARLPVWNSHLGIAHKSYQCALGYDAVYGVLTAAQRKEIAQGLNRLAVIPALNDWVNEPDRIHSLNSMGHNWWTSCVYMGALLALSLQNEVPEAGEQVEKCLRIMPEWFEFAGDNLQQKPRNFDQAGGMYESLNYANFGIQEALLFRMAWMNANPGKTPEPLPALGALTNYFLQVCYPRTGILYNLNFGDSHKNVAAESTLMLLYAQGYKSDDILWYLDQVSPGQHRDGFFLHRPTGFLYMPDFRSAPETPSLQTAAIFEDFGWATLRDDWHKDATMLAVKSGHTWNHSHADANSFILFHKGTDIIKDGGNCWYPNPAYRNYFFQSQAHNVVLFNGEGQSREQQYAGSPLRGYVHHLLNGGNIKYVMANGTGPVAENFSRNYRHFLWMDNVIYLVDDLKTHKNGSFQWLWHPNGTMKKSGIDYHLTNDSAAVVIRPLYPRMLAKSDFVHDYPEDLYWEEIEAPTEDLKGTENYVAFHLPGEVNRVKGLTAIILKDSPRQRELPQMERRQGQDWIGLRVRDKGKVTDLYINQLADGRLMHSNSWITADGWTTDAYMFAVSYPEGSDPADTGELFVCYGSALRRGRTSYFSSLSKLYLIQKQNGKETEVVIDGQPRIRASVRSLKKPASLRVNQMSMPVLYDAGQLKIQR